jgi:hypothetical protein
VAKENTNKSIVDIRDLCHIYNIIVIAAAAAADAAVRVCYRLLVRACDISFNEVCLLQNLTGNSSHNTAHLYLETAIAKCYIVLAGMLDDSHILRTCMMIHGQIRSAVEFLRHNSLTVDIDDIIAKYKVQSRSLIVRNLHNISYESISCGDCRTAICV